MIKIINNFFFTLSTFTRTPTKNVEYNEDNTKYTFFFLPLVGLILGVIYYFIAIFCMEYLNNPAIVAIILLVINILVTGGIHFDGYLDSSDAFKSYRSYEEKKRIIKDSNIGAFALIDFVLILGLYFIAYYYLLDTKLFILLLVAPLVSRNFTLILICYNKQEENDMLEGLMSKMIKKYHLIFFLAYLACTILLMNFVFEGSIINMSILLTVVAFGYTLFFNKTFKKHFLAMSGDLCGYFIVVMEMLLPLLIVLLYPILGLLT